MSSVINRRYLIKGVVQGVGFRPFVYRLASENNLKGWVLNDSKGVTVEVEGTKEQLNKFVKQIMQEKPSLSTINEISLLHEKIIKHGYINFSIKKSANADTREALVSPDTNVCHDCLRELFDDNNRRYKYPFINCTNCGPRYSIIFDIPYDRPYTTMRDFLMCKECKKEYEDILDRRFHAQPIACWDCGPKVELLNNQGKKIEDDDPVAVTIEKLKQGAIVAVKGLGGYHLVADPTNDEAVITLRKRKKRLAKPFAIMSETITEVRRYANVQPDEEKLLTSKERPIVLLKKKKNKRFSDNVAPVNDHFGVMLAYTPLHYLLLHNNFDALICTSGNLSDEAIIHRNETALKKLSKIADFFLIHNREIYTRLDDSIVRVTNLGNISETSLVRRARSYVPMPYKFIRGLPNGLALGSELKNTICLNRQQYFFMSQHIGDLKNLSTYESFKEIINLLKKLLQIEPQFIACDMHPVFYNTKYAYEQNELPVFPVQHHHAHMASCMFEHGFDSPAIGVIFDGVGYGLDGSLWGGEFLVGDYLNFTRKGYFHQFKLLGGDKAVEEPYRIAFELLYQIYSKNIYDLPVRFARATKEKLNILSKMSDTNINSPITSSVGRLFDAVSALLGVREIIEYEGQAAIELEQLSSGNDFFKLNYEINKKDKIWEVNFLPMLEDLIRYKRENQPTGKLGLSFHLTLSEIVVEMCNKIRSETQINEVMLSGGVFLNQILLKNCYLKLKANKFNVHTNNSIPINDGGISIGQSVIAGHRFLKGLRN